MHAYGRVFRCPKCRLRPLSGVKVKSPLKSILIFLDCLLRLVWPTGANSRPRIPKDVAMLNAKPAVPVTVKHKGVPEATRDSPLWKRIGSSAVFRMTVKAFLYWVGRKLISIMMGEDEL